MATRIVLKKRFITVGVAAADLRALVEGRRTPLKLRVLARLGGVDLGRIATVLGHEISLPTGPAGRILGTDAAKLLVSFTESVIASRDPGQDLHALLLVGVEAALAQDGRLCLLEVLEQMPAEVEVNIDRLQALLARLPEMNAALAQIAAGADALGDLFDRVGRTPPDGPRSGDGRR